MSVLIFKTIFAVVITRPMDSTIFIHPTSKTICLIVISVVVVVIVVIVVVVVAL